MKKSYSWVVGVQGIHNVQVRINAEGEVVFDETVWVSISDIIELAEELKKLETQGDK